MTDPNKKHTHNDKDESRVYVHGAIEAHPPEGVIKQHNAERKEDNATHVSERQEDRGRESKKLLLELFTLIAVSIYAGIAFWQGCLTRESITNNTKQFQIDQRPYIWTTNIKPQTTIVAKQRMWVNISLVDYGKSPSLKTRVTGQIFIGPNAAQDADQWFAGLGDRSIAAPNEPEMVIPPGIPELPPPTKDGSANSGFGGGGFFTLLSDKVLEQADVDYILNTDRSAVIVGRLEYFDGFGNRYWSNFCLSRFANGNMPFCPRHNEIH